MTSIEGRKETEDRCHAKWKILPSRANILYTIIGQTLNQADIARTFAVWAREHYVLPRGSVIKTALLYSSLYHIRWPYIILPIVRNEATYSFTHSNMCS